MMKGAIWVTVVVALFAFLFALSGCGSTTKFIKNESGMVIKQSRPGIAKYEDKTGVKASVDCKGQPLINLGTLPDVELPD